MLFRSGKPTNAIFGFARFLNKIIKEIKPDYLAVCFDSGKATFRHSIYENYKATRKSMPDNMKEQIPIIKEMVKLYGIQVFEKEGFEADDLLATLANLSLKDVDKIYLVTPDKDACQLVTECIYAHDIKKNLIITPEVVKEKYLLEPNQLIDYFALVGDSSDNIPGVNGIGPKKASQLISEWKNIENIYQNIDKINPEKLRNLLEIGRENAYLSKKLFIINSSVEINFSIHLCHLPSEEPKELISLWRKLGFNSLITEQIEPELEDNIENTEKKEIEIILPLNKIETKIANSKIEIESLVEILKKEKEIIIEIALTGEHVWDYDISGIDRKSVV